MAVTYERDIRLSEKLSLLTLASDWVKGIYSKQRQTNLQNKTKKTQQDIFDMEEQLENEILFLSTEISMQNREEITRDQILDVVIGKLLEADKYGKAEKVCKGQGTKK